MVEEIKSDNETETKTESSWTKLKPTDVEKKVIELAKSGETPAKIGLILRDKYGVPKVKLLGKKIMKILNDAGIEYPTEEKAVKSKVEIIKKHLANNKHDYPASRSLAKKLWAIHRFEQKN